MRLAELAQWLHQPEVVREFADGGGFSAGDDEAIQTVKMTRQTHFGGFDAEATEYCEVFGKVTL